jgi:hypothetical protein
MAMDLDQWVLAKWSKAREEDAEKKAASRPVGEAGQSSEPSGPPMDLTRYEGHTPGPWHVAGKPHELCVVNYDAAYIVDRFRLGGWTEAQHLANARLIADAPAILAYARELEGQARRGWDAYHGARERVTELEAEVERLKNGHDTPSGVVHRGGLADIRDGVAEVSVGGAPANGVALIAAERRRQVEKEGWTPEHDDEHADDKLASAAACYAAPKWQRAVTANGVPALWPWDKCWWKPSPDNRIRELAKAGALVAAEIDRLSRHAGKEGT